VAREQAEQVGSDWASLGQGSEAAARRARAARVAALPSLPRRGLTVQLRHRRDQVASYQVVLDRFDVRTTTLARYTLILEDVPGAHVSRGDLELEARDHFAEALGLLDDQDAALAFAVLQERVVSVQEVVRGVIGPCYAHGAGPALLGGVGADVIASACLERASVDLADGRVDDPLAASVVVPSSRGFGLSRRRKWAVAEDDVPHMRSWLGTVGSRGLVYGWR
jgi:hypothetical protein